MRLVIADTGPINYLILIGHIDLLSALFEKVILSEAVQSELADPDAPREVRIWSASPPQWLEVRATPGGYFDMDPWMESMRERDLRSHCLHSQGRPVADGRFARA